MAKAFTYTNDNILLQLKTKVTLISGDKFMSFIALWDTGATNTCISYDVATQLQLIPTGKRHMFSPAGDKDFNTYLVDINLPNDVLIEDVVVCDSEIGKQSLDVLIGMDIISQGDFAVSNYNNKTVFTFRTPSQQRTDYVKQITVNNIIGKSHGSGKRKKNKK